MASGCVKGTAGCAAALPILTFNSVTLLGAEVFGRSYGGGILKWNLVKRSAPLPKPEALTEAWVTLKAPQGSPLTGTSGEGVDQCGSRDR